MAGLDAFKENQEVKEVDLSKKGKGSYHWYRLDCRFSHFGI